MSHASPAATATESTDVSSSTTVDPPHRRATSTTSPATIELIAIMRRIERRRPRAIQRAIAQSAIGTSQSHRPSTLATRVRSWAVSNWSACMIVMRPASGERRVLRSPTIATCSPSWMISGRRSRTTSPPSVLTSGPVSSSSTLIRFLMRQRDRANPQLLDARTLEEPPRGTVGAEGDRTCDRPREALLSRRKLLAQRRFDIHVLKQLIDEGCRYLVADLGIGDQLAGGAFDGVRVERLEPDVARQQGGDHEQRAEDDEDPRDQHAAHDPCLSQVRADAVVPFG